MRKFSSYGPIDKDAHYYAPRNALIEQALGLLVGDAPAKGGHYITIWASRQRGKTWLMREVMERLRAADDYETAILSIQSAKDVTTIADVLEILHNNLCNWFQRDFPKITKIKDLHYLFSPPYFTKPLILILDEFDALNESFINQFANQFRDIYIRRANEIHKSSGEKSNLLHGLALIGVRSVLGIENVTGSPFNIQYSLPVPNLTFAEIEGMFQWYQQERGQQVLPEVIERLFYETQGQPGLISWFGQLLTDTYNKNPDHPLTSKHFDYVFLRATHLLPNNTILNIISKAKQEPYRTAVLELFKTDQKIVFRYDDPDLNFLYLNGVIDVEETDNELYTKFASPFVQKRLFNYFAHTLFRDTGQLYSPFADLSDTITETNINLKNLLRRYESYLKQNKDWLFKNSPRRSDLRIYEAVYHFNLYMYLQAFLRSYKGQVHPEFPTGNGQIDLLIQYNQQSYALELKSYTHLRDYNKALQQAAQYGQQLNLKEITLIFFVETIDKSNRETYETIYRDEGAKVTVFPVFVETGA